MTIFKVGDRVKFEFESESDIGTVVRPWNNNEDTFISKEPRWWVKWDSNGGTEHVTEEFMTLIKTEFTPAIPDGKCYTDLIKEAAHLAISDGRYLTAIRTLKLLVNEQYD